MTITQAIEILTLDVKGDLAISYQDWQDALKLGIEALKRTLRHRENTPSNIYIPLPGETSA